MQQTEQLMRAERNVLRQLADGEVQATGRHLPGAGDGK
jgi:hypothetical protein